MNRGRRKAGLFPKFEKFLADAMQTGGTLFGNDLAITSAHAHHVVGKRFDVEENEKNSGVSRDGFGGFYYDPKKDKRTQYEKDKVNKYMYILILKKIIYLYKVYDKRCSC